MAVCTSFVYVLWVHCDFDLMIFLEREVREQEDGVVVGVDCPLAEQLLPLISTEESTQWQSPRCPKSKFLAVERGKVLPRCPKSTMSKVRRCQKKSKFGGSLTRSGVRVRGLGLVWTSAPTRSDRDQHQTRSRTRHRNLTRLVSHVLLTSLLLDKVEVQYHVIKSNVIQANYKQTETHSCKNTQKGMHIWKHYQS